MCLSDLGRVVRHDPTRHDAIVDVDGAQRRVSTIALGLDGPALATGDWLVIHTGLAVERLDRPEAEQIRRFRRELGDQTAKEQPWN